MKHSLDKLVLPVICVSMLAVTSESFAGTASATAPTHGAKNRTHIEVGTASWYGPGFNGHPCADGSRFDQTKLTAAHRSLPLGTQVQVTNLENGKSVHVRITDRGPYSGGRVLDLSKAAADKLNMLQNGVATVQIVAGTRTTYGWAVK